jgi:hypothetical protein
VYRNVELRQQWLGLEPIDALALGVLAWLLLTFNRSAFGWNALLLAAGYVGMRIGKRGKPDGYTTSLARFYLRRPFHSAAGRDVVGAAHPFPIAVASSAGPLAARAFSRTGKERCHEVPVS